MLTKLQGEVRSIMSEILGCEPHCIDEDTTMDSLEEWDSLQHLNLILALEQAFSVRFTTDEVTEMQSFEKIISVLLHHGINK